MSTSSFLGGAALVITLVFGYAQSQDGMCALGWPAPLCLLAEADGPPEPDNVAGRRDVADPQSQDDFVSPSPEVEQPSWVEDLPQNESFEEKPQVSTQVGPVVPNPGWIERPSRRQINRYYPSRALERGEIGQVDMECLVDASGQLSCVVIRDENPNWGFAAAALRLSRRLRVATCDDAGKPTTGQRATVSVRFELV